MPLGDEARVPGQGLRGRSDPPWRRRVAPGLARRVRRVSLATGVHRRSRRSRRVLKVSGTIHDESVAIESWARRAAAAWARSTGPSATTTPSRRRSRSSWCAAAARTDLIEWRFRQERQILARLQHPNIAARVRRRDLHRRSPLPGDGAGRRPAHHRVLRCARARRARPDRDAADGLRRGPLCPPERRHPPRPEAGEHPGHERGRAEASRLRHRQAPRLRASTRTRPRPRPCSP